MMTTDMMSDPEELLEPHFVAEMFGVSPKTLTNWSNASPPKLRARFTAGGHRRYRVGDVLDLMAKLEVRHRA